MKHLYVILLCLSLQSLQATHLVGGEITYECLGNNEYLVTLIIFRDCGPTSQAPFDNPGNLTVYRGNGQFYASISAPLLTTVQLPNTTNNPCLQAPPNVCTEKGIYQFMLTLPPDPEGYLVVHQRCCRNNSINNIPNPGSWGNTYAIEIPANPPCNSSPSFNYDPPVVLCSMDSLYLDQSVTDLDGDSIYYELCAPLHGGGNQVNTGNGPNSPLPIPASAPPYTNVPFGPLYNVNNPLPANPGLAIDPFTGIMTGTPNALGQFVFAICATEYRNGVPLSTVRRDFQFNVVNCNSNVIAVVMPQDIATRCIGRTLQFFENSLNASFFEWDFGDPASGPNNTSTLTSPTHTFSDTGLFEVRLIANPGWPCADTTTRLFYVQDPIDAAFDVITNNCFDDQQFQFVFRNPGEIPTDALIEWDFSPGAVTRFSNDLSPPNITFQGYGPYTITVTITYKSCVATFSRNIELFDRPSISTVFSDRQGCAPFEFQVPDINLGTVGNFEIEWDFGDGNQSTQLQPTHIFDQPGVFFVNMKLFTTSGCIDTLYNSFRVTVYRTPISNFVVDPDQVSYYEPMVKVTNIGATPEEQIYTEMGDGAGYLGNTFTHNYSDTGRFTVMHIITTPDGCADTSYAEVYVFPETLVFVPQVFTPNEDGVNDIFQWSVTGVREFEMIIFSRWGDQVFRTEDPNEYWNGGYNNVGNPMQEGVYTWVIYARGINNKVINRHGTVLLSK